VQKNVARKIETKKNRGRAPVLAITLP